MPIVIRVRTPKITNKRIIELKKEPLQACVGLISLSWIKVQAAEVKEDVGFEAFFVAIAKGLFDQTLDGVV
jgi:hypothetical protein